MITESIREEPDEPNEPAEPEGGEPAPEEGGEGSGDEAKGDGEGAGPAEDIQNDPAYNPDDEELKGIKGG